MFDQDVWMQLRDYGSKPGYDYNCTHPVDDFKIMVVDLQWWMSMIEFAPSWLNHRVPEKPSQADVDAKVLKDLEMLVKEKMDICNNMLHPADVQLVSQQPYNWPPMLCDSS